MPETAVVVDIQDGRFNNFTDNVIKLSDDETKWTGLPASENNHGMFSGPKKLPGLKRQSPYCLLVEGRGSRVEGN